jgi:CTP synthase
MLKEKLDQTVLRKLKITNYSEPNLEAWRSFLHKLKHPKNVVKIGLVGKYNELPDAYKSIYEAFTHAGATLECKVKVDPIHAEELEGETALYDRLKDMDGVLVAPGFGERGIEGKIKAVEFVRKSRIPFFGICLGLQCAVSEFGRNVIGLEGACSTELNPQTPHPVIDLMDEQKKIVNKGGTMRLGAYRCKLAKDSKAYAAYNDEIIEERHRHRYEFNNEYLEQFEAHGLKATGINPESNLVEIVEAEDHPYFLAVKYHPELKSTVENPHPLFTSFIEASLKYQLSKLGAEVNESLSE